MTINGRLGRKNKNIEVHFTTLQRRVKGNKAWRYYLYRGQRCPFLQYYLLSGNVEKVSLPLDNIITRLAENFKRIHRSAIVNLEYVTLIEKDKEVLYVTGGKSLNIGRKFQSDLIDEFDNWTN